jgi:hypothetical protein
MINKANPRTSIVPPVIPPPGEEDDGYEVPQIEPTPFISGKPKTGVEYWRDKAKGGDVVPVAKNVSLEQEKILEDTSEASMSEKEKLLLIDIGGKELLGLSRHNQINGITQEYTPISNLADISLEYNPLSISVNPNNITDYISTFNFDLIKYIPTQNELDELYPLGQGMDGADVLNKRNVVYFDKVSNSLVVHVKNIYFKENVEVEFFVPSEVKDGTIY